MVGNNYPAAPVAQLGRQTERARDSLRIQGEAFWELQDQLLDRMERMSRAWFARCAAGGL
jgi:hypothetical protein